MAETLATLSARGQFACEPARCPDCECAIVEMPRRWLCSWCGVGGHYVEFVHAGRRLRARVVERKQVAHA